MWELAALASKEGAWSRCKEKEGSSGVGLLTFLSQDSSGDSQEAQQILGDGAQTPGRRAPLPLHIPLMVTLLHGNPPPLHLLGFTNQLSLKGECSQVPGAV